MRLWLVLLALVAAPGMAQQRESFNTAAGTDVLVAFDRDGQPLRDGEGRIALVSLADERPGARYVKWLSRIEVKRVPG